MYIDIKVIYPINLQVTPKRMRNLVAKPQEAPRSWDLALAAEIQLSGYARVYPFTKP